MGPRAALAAVVLACVGCATESPPAGTDMGAPGSDLGAFAGDMGKSCPLITITAEIDPRTGAQKSYAPALLTATTDARGVTGPTWTVQRTGDPQVHTPTPTDPSKLTVQFYAPDPGTWTFVLTFSSGAGCMPTQSITLGNPTGVKVPYRLRALPPESSGYPLKDTPIVLIGGTPMMKDLQLDSGTPLMSTLLGPSGSGTPGEVRFIADAGPDAVTLTGASGAFTVALLDSGRYQTLLIPRSTMLAPHLGAAGQLVGDLANASFTVGAGETVGGSVGDGATTLSGVRVVLRAGALPSGPGVSDGSGAFALHAERGSYTLSFGSDAWPQASLGGVVVPAGGVSVGIQYTVARVAVGGTVVASDGTTPVGGARVTIRSRPLGAVASVTVGGAPPVAVGGRVARVVTTDAGGRLPALLLPAGIYDLIVEPPSSSGDGLTAITQPVSSAANWTLTLQPTLTLSGVIRGAAGQLVAGARVTAIETVGLGASPSTTSDAAGHYALTVDRGAPVALLVEPGAADKLSGSTLLLPAGTSSAAVTLGPGLLVSGVVRSPGNSTPVPSVRVEALCGGCASTTPVASAISDARGVYSIYLPDPGDIITDGGTD